MDKLTIEAIADIARNNQLGAAEIAEQGAEVLLHCAQTDEIIDIEHFRQDLHTAIWGLIHAQPAMAPLVNLVNAVLWKLDTTDSLRMAQQRVMEVTNDFKRQLHVHEAAIAESVLPLIPDGAKVLTTSRSTTVRAALRHAQRAGRHFSVICAEGRPGCEGRKMAHELADDGIPVMLVVDALAISLTPRSHLVLVGADHLTADGLMNKVGTYGVALAAHTNNVPVYALCSSAKFLPPDYAPPSQIRWPASQVWEDPPTGVAVKNVYFDCTPLGEISGLVTEQGVLPTAGVEGWLASIQLHPALMQLPPIPTERAVNN